MLTNRQVEAVYIIKDYVYKYDMLGDLGLSNMFDVKTWTVEEKDNGRVVVVTSVVDCKGEMAGHTTRRKLFVDPEGEVSTWTINDETNQLERIVGCEKALAYGTFR